MNKIAINQIVNSTYLNSEGIVLYNLLNPYLRNNQNLELSFKGVSPFSSSFFNSSFQKLFMDYGYEHFKKYVKITDLNSTQAKWLRKYFDDYLLLYSNIN